MSIIPKGVVLSATLPEILMEITSVEILFDKEQIFNLKVKLDCIYFIICNRFHVEFIFVLSDI